MRVWHSVRLQMKAKPFQHITTPQHSFIFWYIMCAYLHMSGQDRLAVVASNLHATMVAREPGRKGEGGRTQLETIAEWHGCTISTGIGILLPANLQGHSVSTWQPDASLHLQLL